MRLRMFACMATILLLPVIASASISAVSQPEGANIPSAAVSPPALVLPQQPEVQPSLPPVKMLTIEELNRRRLQRLQDVSREIRAQRESMADFDNYLKWMGGALAGYGKYVEAGSFAAGFAKYLPVPYAGQAGQLTKFISHFALSISATSAAVTSYRDSSKFFISGVEAIGTSPMGKESDLAMLTFYADQQLSRDMLELRGRLESISGLSGSALSFLLGLQQYLGNTDEYWQKTKSLVSRKDAEKADKGALAGSIDGLRSRAEAFNGKLKQYDSMVSATMPRIASLVAYDELRQDMEAKSVQPAVVNESQNNSKNIIMNGGIENGR